MHTMTLFTGLYQCSDVRSSNDTTNNCDNGEKVSILSEFAVFWSTKWFFFLVSQCFQCWFKSTALLRTSSYCSSCQSSSCRPGKLVLQLIWRGREQGHDDQPFLRIQSQAFTRPQPRAQSKNTLRKLWGWTSSQLHLKALLLWLQTNINLYWRQFK